MKLNNIVRICINTFIGILLIFLWLQFVNLQEVTNVLKNTDLRYFVLFLITFCLSIIIRALRLKLMLEDLSLTIKQMIPLTALSQFLSFFIPIRAGEIAKSIYISNQFSLPLGKSIIWILIDRFLDFWATFLLIAIFVIFVTTNLPNNFEHIIFAVLTIFTIAAAFVIISPKSVRKIAVTIGKLIIYPKAKRLFLASTDAILDGFLVLPKNVFKLSILIVLSSASALADSFGWLIVFLSLDIHTGFLKTFLGSLLVSLTFLLPAAPGYVGSAEASGLAVFSAVLGLDPNLASAASLLEHIYITIILLVLGVISIYLLNFNLHLLWKKLKFEKD